MRTISALPADRPARPRATWKSAWVLVGGLILVAGVLRVWGIQAKSLWGDEIISLALSTGHSWYPWMGEETELFYSASHYRDQLSLAPTYFSQRLIALLRVNDQLPLYYALLNLWLHLFGTSEAAVRSLSLVANVGSIPILYALGRLMASRQVGLYSAAILALAPFQVVFALYNRPYALLGFFALLSTLAAVHLSRGAGWRWLLVYVASVILGVYTHYLFVWNLAFQIPFVVFCQRHNRPLVVRFCAACLAAAGVCLAWAPIVAAQARWSREVGANSWFYWYAGIPTLQATLASLGHTVVKLLSAGKLTGLCDGYQGGGECRLDGVVTVISYVVPLLLSGFVFWRMVRHFRTRFRGNSPTPDPWSLCLFWGACVFAGPVIMDALLHSHMVYSHRYFISASGPVYLIVAMALAETPRPYLRRSIGAGVLAFLLVSSGLYLQGSSATMMHEVGVREVARHIDRRAAGARDLVLVLDPGFSPQDFAYYLESNPDFARVDVPAWRPSAPDIGSQLMAIAGAKQRDRIWYLDERGLEAGARTRVLAWLRTHYAEVEAREFTNIGVFLFSPGEQPHAPLSARE